ncbi:hypothetical protein D0Z00_001877 [Geotrichum galactomycetum]|uniref:Uncharacterized protein n=1 Tax=Geotrichum galactomycetum TaxID=27317 RepID=A0ACB6V5M1_9ASCO|nr:hypothetical protein D0Z00_001877 [Geotrichum candidum]
MFVKSIVGAAVAATAVSAAPIAHGAHPHSFKVPTLEEAAVEARTLVNRESLANLATIDVAHNNVPVSFMEYYADCDNDGSLTLLSLNIGSSFRNIAKGSPATLSIRVGDHAINDEVDIHYPGGIVESPAGSPRISLRGKFVEVDASEHERLAKCFVSRHPDSKWWLPGNPIHSSKWTKFEVEGAYFLGGFGDRAYIGEIPQDVYSAAQPQVPTVKPAKKCNKKKHTEEKNESIFDQLWIKVSQLFGDFEEQVHEVTDKKPDPHHQNMDFQHNEHSEQVLASHHGAHSDLSEEELFAAHHNGMSFEEFEAAHKAHNLERRGDFDLKPSGSQVPFITPKRISNKEAGKRMKAILEAQKKGTN